jgi:hypothetical protein
MLAPDFVRVFASTTVFVFVLAFAGMYVLTSFSKILDTLSLCHLIGYILLKSLSNALEWNALEDGVEEPLHDNLLCFGLRDTA